MLQEVFHVLAKHDGHLLLNANKDNQIDNRLLAPIALVLDHVLNNLLEMLFLGMKGHCLQQAAVHSCAQLKARPVKNVASEQVVFVLLLPLSFSRDGRDKHLKEHSLNVRNDVVELVSLQSHSQGQLLDIFNFLHTLNMLLQLHLDHHFVAGVLKLLKELAVVSLKSFLYESLFLKLGCNFCGVFLLANSCSCVFNFLRLFCFGDFFLRRSISGFNFPV